MRVLTGFAVCAFGILAATSVAGWPQPRPQEIVVKPLGPRQVQREITRPPPPKSGEDSVKEHEIICAFPVPPAEPFVPPSLETDKEIAGLSKGSRPELLTWERVYALAVVRVRSRRGAYLESLAPAALEAEAARNGIADFAGFATLFVAVGPLNGVMAFPDPSAAVLELLRRLQTIENARVNVALHEMFDKWIQKVANGESGLNQLDVDLVRASWDRARRRLAEEIAQYRDELEKFKIAVGLRPRGPSPWTGRTSRRFAGSARSSSGT